MVERKYTMTLKNGTIREVVREEKERHSAIGLWRYMLKWGIAKDMVIEFKECVILASEIVMISKGEEIND